ncbi:MAG: hypothetical protein U0840_07270 [Gemmataceae bacterium]
MIKPCTVNPLLLLLAVSPVWGQAETTNWLPPPPVVSPDNRPGQVSQTVALSGPLWTDQGHSLTLQAGLQTELIPGRVPILDGTPLTPEQFWNMTLGMNAARTFESGWTAGGHLHLGYRSDLVLLDPQRLNADLRAFLKVPTLDQDAITLAVNYTPLGLGVLPTPSVGYNWVPRQNISAEFGIPLPLAYSAERTRLELASPPTVTGQIRLRW